jgi:hypothetical protein
VFGFYLLVLTLLDARERSKCFIKAALLIFLLVVFSGTHTLVGNEIIGNFFYPQLIGDFGFVLLLVIASIIQRPKMVCVFAIAAVYGLAWIYPMSASKLALSLGLLQILALCRGYSRERVVAAIAMAVLLPVIIVTHPAFEPMVRNAAHDGGISITLPIVLAAASVLLALAACIWWLNFARASGARYDPLMAAALATALLAWVQFGCWHFAGLGSPYAVKKHGFMICTLAIASFAVCLAELAFRTGLHSRLQGPLKIVPMYVTRWVAACLAVVAVLPGRGAPLKPVLRYDNEVRAIMASGVPADLFGHTVSVNRDLPMVINFAVGVAVLHLPAWSPAMRDQLGIREPAPSGVRYAVTVPMVPNLPLGCLVQTYRQLQLLRRDCVEPKWDR